MDSRLQRNEKTAVRNKFGDNDLFLFIQAPCAVYERKSAKHKLSTEELFYECMIVLDRIKENPQNATIWMGNLWNDLYNSYNDPRMEYEDEDVRTSATEVVLCVSCCLGVYKSTYYNKLNILLMKQITECYPDFQEMLENYSAGIYRLGEERFRNAVVAYMDSRDFYSDDIADLIQGISSPEQLTITQSIFLFAGLFDVSLDKDYTSQSKLAELIGRITPYDSESIRTRISELQKLHEKDAFTRKIREDIELAAKIIDDYSGLKHNHLREEYLS